MQTEIFDTKAPKKAANLSINADLLRQAKERRINLSKVLELRLAELLREEKCRRWEEENGDAISDYNQRVDAQGSFGDHVRRF